MSERTQVLVDAATHARLEALGRQVDLPVGDIVTTLSYADFEVLLQLHARRTLMRTAGRRPRPPSRESEDGDGRDSHQRPPAHRQPARL